MIDKFDTSDNAPDNDRNDQDNKTIREWWNNPPPRCDHLFDPWLMVQPSRSSVRRIEKLLEPAVMFAGEKGRKRALRRDCKKNRNAILKAIVANLVYARLSSDGRIAVSLGMANLAGAYERKGFNQLATVIKRLRDSGLLRLHKSITYGYASVIEVASDTEPGKKLADAIKQAELSLRDCSIGSRKEAILLGIVETKTGNRGAPQKSRKNLDYKNTTAHAYRFRREMRQINAALASADLRLTGMGDLVTGDIIKGTMTVPRGRFDTDSGVSRHLRRLFSVPSWFDKHQIKLFQERGMLCFGGRLHGGWWQNLKKTERHRIRIDGETIVDLDFIAMFVRLAYVAANEQKAPKKEVAIPKAGDGDPYHIPGFEDYRKGVKTVMLAMLSRTEPLEQLPQGTVKLLPPGTTAESIRTAILQKHPALGPIFETGAAYALTFAESQIIVAVLLRLNELGITALPMHDGLMVAASKAIPAKTEMERIAKIYVGFAIPVKMVNMAVNN